MSASDVPASLLVNVELPEPTPFSPVVVDLLASLHIVVVGWYAVPDQTLPAQARDQFEDEAEAALESVVRPFEDAGGDVDSILVFAHDRFDTLRRISRERDCDAVLISGEMEHLRRILVPLRGLPNAHYIAPFVADLVQDSPAEVTLLHVLEDDETDAHVRETVLSPAAQLMTSNGIDAGRLSLHTRTGDAPVEAILEEADDYDAVVIGESEPSVGEILFGTVPEKIAQAARIPVIIVRNPDEDVDAAVQATSADA